MILIIPFLLLFVLMANSFNFLDMLTAGVFVEFLFVALAMTKNWFHVIMIMLLMELLSISIFKIMGLGVLFWMSSIGLFFIMVMMVIEASLGMSLVVASARCFGENSMEV